jgi:acetolactate synthase small subunit
VIVLIGSNLCIAHPIMWERIRRNPHAPEIVVVDPRVTETAMAATQHYAPRPKSDLTLLYGLAHLLIEQGAVDERFVADHTSGYEAFAAHVAAFTPERVVSETGLTAEQLGRFASTIAAGKRVSFWWTMGVNQSHEGVRVAQALINLALMTGNIGRPGTGANSITGQCNAMGSRLFANTTNLLGGHDFTKPEHRAKVAGALGLYVARIPATNSLAYDQILEQISKQLYKLIDVVKVLDHQDEPIVTRELALVKVNAPAEVRAEVMQIVSIFRANIIDIAEETFVVEVTGGADKIDALIGLLRRFGIKEMMRTGRIVLSRGARTA